jgi:hypothetical protein
VDVKSDLLALLDTLGFIDPFYVRGRASPDVANKRITQLGLNLSKRST